MYASFVGENRNLTVAFLDVGQGDSIFIETPNGSQILIDAGRDKKALRELTKFMPFFDRSLDIVIATHPDKDHVGGLPDILKRYKVGVFIDSGVKQNTGAYEAMQLLLDEKEVQVLVLDRELKIVFGDEVILNFLFPRVDASEFSSNTASVVAQLIYGENEFLMMGDSPKSIERYLMNKYGTELQSDVLKVGHHGSKTSSDINFVQEVDPMYAVMSVGKNNRYGHPNKNVLEIFQNEGTEILSTALEGTIVFESDGVVLEKK